MPYELVYTSHARKDAKKIASSGLKEKALALFEILAKNPFKTPPPYEAHIGDLSRAYSKKINILHRIVYQVYEDKKS